MSQCDINPIQKKPSALSKQRHFKLFSAITYHEFLPLSSIKNLKTIEESVLPLSKQDTSTLKHPVSKYDSTSILVSPNHGNKTFISKISLERTSSIHKYKCDLDAKSITCKNNFLPHGNNNTNLDCRVCGKSFQRIASLNNHMEKHEYNKPHNCKICNRNFTSSNALKRHQYIHSDKIPYTCDICNKGYRHLESFRLHKLTIHTQPNAKNYSCPVCNKAFKYSKGLKNHLVTHTGERPHACHICNKNFCYKNNLSRHIKTHTRLNFNVKNKGHHRLKSVKSHKLANHPQPIVKNYPCPVCSRTFKFSTGLKNHLVTHTGEKPYACDICNKSFEFKKNLHQHVKTHK